MDRGALEASLDMGIEHGGWCPKGRRSEDGQVPNIYNLVETSSKEYPPRTKMNVESSDATLIITKGVSGRGTQLTIRYCKAYNKPYMVVDLLDNLDHLPIILWLENNDVKCLNVAGSRESTHSGIQHQTRNFIYEVLKKYNE